MWLETVIGRELPLILFSVTDPGLAAVKVDMLWQPTLYHDAREMVTM